MDEEKYIFKRDREYMLTPAYWNQISHVSLATEKLYGISLSKEYVLYRQGRVKTIFLKKDWDKAENFIAPKLFNEKYFSDITKEIAKKSSAIAIFIKKIKKQNFKKFSFSDLIAAAEAIKKEWLDYDTANIFIWYAGGDKFKSIVQAKLKLSHNDFMFLTTPLVKTAVSKLDYEILKAAKSIKDKKIFIEKAAEKLSENYGWIPFGYDGPEYWQPSHFLDKVKEILRHPAKMEKEIMEIKECDRMNKKIRAGMVKKYKLGKTDILYIDRINLLAVLTDERKRYEFEIHYRYSKILWEFEKRYDIPYKNLKYLFTWELAEIKDGASKIIEKTNWRINNGFMIETAKNKFKIVSENKKEKILAELEKGLCNSEIKGIVASKGNKSKYCAVVKILNSPSEDGKLKKGEFLVTGMTTPDYIMAMKRAGGFITDEGGVTCHAAIVAREMGKPCIIGTKNATRILKDGDMVDVDAERGIVSVLR